MEIKYTSEPRERTRNARDVEVWYDILGGLTSGNRAEVEMSSDTARRMQTSLGNVRKSSWYGEKVRKACLKVVTQYDPVAGVLHVSLEHDRRLGPAPLAMTGPITPLAPDAAAKRAKDLASRVKRRLQK